MIAGSDEAGKGDYFGYLVVACVCCEESSLKGLGVRDSKTLSRSKIFSVEKLIKEKCMTSVITLSPRRYNQLHKDTGGIYNLNQILGWLHAKAISKICEKCNPELIIVDKFGREENVLRNLPPKIASKVAFLPKGERNPVVAASSILARAEFLRKQKMLSKKFGISLPRGSTNVKRVAKEFIRIHSKDTLWEVSKIHFKITREL
jgi:ribonuclease HIII